MALNSFFWMIMVFDESMLPCVELYLQGSGTQQQLIGRLMIGFSGDTHIHIILTHMTPLPALGGAILSQTTS